MKNLYESQQKVTSLFHDYNTILPEANIVQFMGKDCKY